MLYCLETVQVMLYDLEMMEDDQVQIEDDLQMPWKSWKMTYKSWKMTTDKEVQEGSLCKCWESPFNTAQ